jgi:flagellar hook protein FlgE
MSVEGVDIDLVREVVDMKLAKAGVSANAAVMRTADQMQGTVLDILV